MNQMFDSKSEKAKMKPIIYHPGFRRSSITSLESPFIKKLVIENSDLLKYFPKYCRELEFLEDCFPRSIKSRLKKLKVLRQIFICKEPYCDEKFIKELLKNCRKTLTSLPTTGFKCLSLCTFFPRVKTIELDLDEQIQEMEDLEEEDDPKEIQKRIYSSSGYFWSANRFVKQLSIYSVSSYNMIILKKLDSSKRFLSSVKTIELHLDSSMREALIELLTLKNLLRHATYLEISSQFDEEIDWKLVQSLINCCSRIYDLSISTEESFKQKDFRLDLSSLGNLQGFYMRGMESFRSALKKIDFPSSIKKISLSVEDSKQPKNSKKALDCQEDGRKDGIDWKSFEKWKKLGNLKTLELEMWISSKEDTMRDFFLPLLKEIPQLETFRCLIRPPRYGNKKEKKPFNLDLFFSAIESLQLKHLKVCLYYGRIPCKFSGSVSLPKSVCLSKLSSIEINMGIYSHFDLKKFLDEFLFIDDTESEMAEKKTLIIRELTISCVKDFFRLLQLMDSISKFKNLQIDINILFIVQDLKSIFSNFHYPIHVSSNTMLSVKIFLKNFEDSMWTPEVRRHFQMIFRQIEFAVIDPCRRKPSAPIDPYSFHNKYIIKATEY